MVAGSFYINRTAGSTYITYRVDWQSVSNGSVANSSNVTVCVYAIKSSSSSSATYGTANTTVTVGSSSQSENGLNFSVSPGSETLLFAKGGFVVEHDGNGAKQVTISVSIGGNIIGASGYNTVTLDTIPRYANVNQSLYGKTETTITMTWGADVNCDFLQYSIDGGNTFVNASGYPNYMITGLSPNSTYNIVTRVRRTDSQLWSQTGALAVTTYAYPHCTSSPNFTIGDALTLDFYNPLGRSIAIAGYAKTDGSQIFTGSTSGTRLVGFNDSGSVERQYESIPNSKSGAYKVVVTYGSVIQTRDTGNTYSIKGTETPTVNGITYKDANAYVASITKNPQHIVQNQSTLEVTFDDATANYYANISKYEITVNGVTKTATKSGEAVDFGKINTSSNCDIIIKVTDSRGMTSTAKKTVTVLAWALPIVTASLERLNNYEDETYLTVDASISSVNGKNSMSVSYQYKESGGEYGDAVSIENNTQYTLTCNKEKSYIFSITVADMFDSITTELVLDKGKFPLFIDTQKNAVGINDFPAEGEALCVAEGVARFNDGIVLFGATKKFLLTVNDSGALNITEMN